MANGISTGNEVLLKLFKKSRQSKEQVVGHQYDQYAANTHRGLDFNCKNLDRIAIVQSLNVQANSKSGQCSYFAIYEGLQDSSAAAEYLRDNLHHLIFCDKSFPENPTKALYNSIKAAAKHINEVLNQGDIYESSHIVVLLLVDDICLCASIGSCRAIMSSDCHSKLYCLNTDHVFPGNELEEARVISLANQFGKGMNLADKKELNLYINSLFLSETRVMGRKKWE